MSLYTYVANIVYKNDTTSDSEFYSGYKFRQK